MKFIVVIFSLMLISACSPKDEFDGSIPNCKELLSQDKASFVELASQKCEQARTMEEKIKNVGCAVKDKANHCKRSNVLSNGSSSIN